jgi:SAM-dependent methyltransferase
MVEPVAEHYDARWGYRHFDAERYERRRYGGLGRRLNLRLTERALARALAGVPPGSLVLDAPCGTGILSAFLQRRGFRVVGADISPAMLAVARRRGAALGHVRADLEHPPCGPRSVDAVVSSRFMMHLPADTRTRMFRIMADLARGPVIATVCHPYTWKSFQRGLRRGLGGNAKRSPRLTRRMLSEEAASAGLRLERVIPVLPVLSEVWVVVLRTLPRPS